MENENIKEIIKLLNIPKIEIGLSEKRSIGQYESKEYTAKVWIPLGQIPAAEELSKIADNLQKSITMQQIKDGLKPLRMESSKNPSIITKAFNDAYGG